MLYHVLVDDVLEPKSEAELHLLSREDATERDGRRALPLIRLDPADFYKSVIDRYPLPEALAKISLIVSLVNPIF
ncbi:hypothetical protein CYMTET_17964 [Cymbomonas tetramitiformis]|uniref:Uncharacterized protein n=1 Tax=Cymbomonas tetramitiformis TaxID=36881 RepID=A0AAE0G917_9CHLO|nr:hypothetical protein CYMTET_17964 [Cymbomonas tetramitiformis]